MRYLLTILPLFFVNVLLSQAIHPKIIKKPDSTGDQFIELDFDQYNKILTLDNNGGAKIIYSASITNINLGTSSQIIPRRTIISESIYSIDFSNLLNGLYEIKVVYSSYPESAFSEPYKIVSIRFFL